MASFSVGDKSDILYLCVGFRYLMEDPDTITGDSYKGGVMKLSAVIFLSLVTTGCALSEPAVVVQESFFVPVIRSDVSSSGYTPSVTPMMQTKSTPRIYTPVLR
jgi:hypothetical protein